MQAWLAAAIARRPVFFLVANLAVAALLVVAALGAPERLAVGGGAERGGGPPETELLVVLEAEGAIRGAVAREAQAVIESGLLADPAVQSVEPIAGGRDDQPNAILVVTVGGGSAVERQQAAERIAERIDPGPFGVIVGGEPGVQAAAREQIEDELPRLALLAAPFLVLVLVLAFGVRLAVAPLLAAATAALGAVALLRVVPGSLDLTAVGLAVAVAVGLAVAVESCLVVRRASAGATFDAQEAMLSETIGAVFPRIAWACLGATLAAAALFTVPLPGARSAAIGGIAAAVIAGAASLIATPSALALWPARPPSREESLGWFAGGGRGGRLAAIADEIAIRPALAWIPALAVLAVLGIGTAQAFDTGTQALAAADLGPRAEVTRVAELLEAELPTAEAERLASGTSPVADDAAELISSRLPWILVAITAAGLLAAYGATRSARRALAHGIGAALPAGATCGLLALAAEGSLPFDVEIVGEAPYASALLATVAALGAIGVARAALADARAALAGSLVAGAALGVLAGIDLDAVAQLGVAIAAGIAIDLVLVRAILAPCLERALPARFIG